MTPDPEPRTDAEKTRSWEERRKERYTSEARAGHSNDGWKFARQLERDLSTLRKAAEGFAEIVEEMLHFAFIEPDSVIERVDTALASLRSELAKTTPANLETPAPHPG